MTSALSASDQQVWKKVLAAKNSAMTQVQIEQSLPGMPKKEVVMSIGQLIKLKLLSTEKMGTGQTLFHGLRPEDAKKKQALTPEQSLVLGLIGQASNRGISQKSIRSHIGADTMPTTQLRKTLDTLEREGHIKVFKGIHQPTVSLYILPHIKPAEELTGGVWYDNQKEYDAEFVNGITSFLLDKVKSATFPADQRRNAADVALVPNAIWPASRTNRLPTPYSLLKALRKSNLTSTPLSVKNVMECMRALELDGLVEAIKPIGEVDYGDAEFSDEGPSKKRRKVEGIGSDDDVDDEERERIERLEREKAKEKAKERKKRERARQKQKEKEKAKEKKRRKKEKKEKERAKEKRRKEKERDKARAKRKAKENDSKKKKKRFDSESDGDPSEDDPMAEDSEELVGIDEIDGPPKKSAKKGSKKDKRKKRKRGSRSSSPEDSDSDDDSEESDSSDSETDPDSDTDSDSDDSDVSISSVDSDDIDTESVAFRPKSTAAKMDSGEVQSMAFARTGLGEITDTQVVYRATNLVHMPLGQTQIACGKCPQFSFCQEGGPVEPDSCVYLDNWLSDLIGGWDPEGRRRYREQPEPAMVEGGGDLEDLPNGHDEHTYDYDFGV